MIDLKDNICYANIGSLHVFSGVKNGRRIYKISLFFHNQLSNYKVIVLYMWCKIVIVKILLKYLERLEWIQQQSKIDDLQTKIGALKPKSDAHC